MHLLLITFARKCCNANAVAVGLLKSTMQDLMPLSMECSYRWCCISLISTSSCTGPFPRRLCGRQVTPDKQCEELVCPCDTSSLLRSLSVVLVCNLALGRRTNASLQDFQSFQDKQRCDSMSRLRAFHDDTRLTLPTAQTGPREWARKGYPILVSRRNPARMLPRM